MAATWLVERGIGETRAALVEGGTILAARVDWHQGLAVGLVAQARVSSRLAGTRRGTVEFADGAMALVDGLTPALPEGASALFRVTRAAIAEKGRTKLPMARPAAPGEDARPAPELSEQLAATGHTVRTVHAHDGALDEAGWDDLIDEAMTGEIAFPRGGLCISPTPAMTLIDVDGSPPLPGLALAAVPAIAAAILRLDIGGSIGIDFPTLAEKRDRQAVDAALAEELATRGAQTGWRGERTAMNGYGFVQLVARLERPSLPALFARHPLGAAARRLLRRAERVRDPGALLLTAHPALARAVRPEWQAKLTRRTGRMLHWALDDSLAPTAGFAQAITP
ncbi:ribonuclease E/G [Novosphingobium pokkalii]|uniref:Ribonuclease E/G n=1 Tax=Novosphingobium pokkalii TaxID=1770194 RepID=A0ABV7UZU7_9SPHN|nr:ribonuclease E/G [Novosphingobium pokkalii]GHC99443.1 hypothetical protein GCM10019060_32120 [Novosphingobium pokkalii]